MNRNIFLVFLFLSGCQAPTIEPFQVLDFRLEEPVTLPVGSIQVENETTRYTDLPHLETRIPVTPAYALSTALENRFSPLYPTSDTAVHFVIKKADLTQKKQKSDHWYVLNNVEYLLEYQVEVLYKKGNIISETQHLSGWEKQALPERSSLREKEAAWQKMINAMITKAITKIQTDIPKPQ